MTISEFYGEVLQYTILSYLLTLFVEYNYNCIRVYSRSYCEVLMNHSKVKKIIEQKL